MIKHIFHRVTAEAMRLFAINTGAFYAEHCRLGRENNLSLWIVHVREQVEPHYRREIGSFHYDGAGRVTVANDLMKYYAEHVKELSDA